MIAAEDQSFASHHGFDWESIRKAHERNKQERRSIHGGSSITQQLAKNLFLSPSRSYLRKAQEAAITLMLEAALSKRRILEIYLNVIEWGDGIYGAEAAARTYFRKPASQLTVDESSLLPACIINPRRMNPDRLSPRLQRRQRLILSRMGAVTPPPDLAPAVAPAANPSEGPAQEPAPEASPRPSLAPPEPDPGPPKTPSDPSSPGGPSD